MLNDIIENINGKYLIKIRQELGMSQKACANFLGISQSYVSRLERKLNFTNKDKAIIPRIFVLFFDKKVDEVVYG